MIEFKFQRCIEYGTDGRTMPIWVDLAGHVTTRWQQFTRSNAPLSVAARDLFLDAVELCHVDEIADLVKTARKAARRKRMPTPGEFRTLAFAAGTSQEK
ncbi:MAG: hypothetical protein ACTSX8_10450 [Alphaproteobacteria bacterium]